MKNLLLLSLIFTAFSAHAASTTDYLKCLRKVGKQRKLSDESIVNLLDSISSYNQNNTDTLIQTCEDTLKASKKNERRSAKALRETISDYSGNRDAAELLRKMLGDHMNCDLHGLSVQVGLAGALGAGINEGVCTVSNGRVMFVVAPSFSCGYGAGVTVSFVERDFSTAEDANSLPADLVGSWAVAVGEVDGEVTTGHSIGLGFSILIDAVAPLKLFPVGNDFSKQIGLLEKIAATASMRN